MKNKRYIRLAKKMTAKCNGRCDSGKCKLREIAIVEEYYSHMQ